MLYIYTKDGKDYLYTYVAKRDNYSIDANALFLDIRELVQKIVAKTNRKFGTRNVFIKSGYGSELQSFLNRFSGDYFSPSFMKSYVANPALNLMQNFFVEGANDATAIGSTFHKILEEYYKLPKEERMRLRLYDLAKKYIPAGQDVEKVMDYIEGYIKAKDYLHPKSELDDTALDCVTEHRGRAQNLYVRSIDYIVPCAVSYVADRIDYRDDEVVILDYKTGTYTPEAVTFDGYLGSMILYKWAMEQELNTKITQGYLIYPSSKKKYYKLDYSIENEKILAGMIDSFYDQFLADNRSRIYKFTEEGYFTTEDAKIFRDLMNNNEKWDCKKWFDIYIGEHEDSVLSEADYTGIPEVK